MRNLFTHILIATVLLHAALGCCLHHAHAVELGGHDTHTEVGHHGDCGHGDAIVAAATTIECEGEGLHRPPAHHDHHGCDDGKCSFARTEISPDPSLTSAADLPATFALPACHVPQLPTFADRSHASPGNVSPGDLRLHLTLAVLLI